METTAELATATRERLAALDTERAAVAAALETLEQQIGWAKNSSGIDNVAPASRQRSRSKATRSTTRPRGRGRFQRAAPADADALLAWARENSDSEVTTGAAAEALGLSREMTRKRFAELAERGALEAIGEGTGRKWRVLDTAAAGAAADSTAETAST